MIFEISLYKLKEIFWKNYGIDFIDGFNLAQSPLNVIQQGEFKLYDNYADEDIYEELPTLKNLFKENDVIYLYTDHAYQESSIFVLRAKEIKKFLKEFPLDIFSNEPLFISFDNGSVLEYGYDDWGNRVFEKDRMGNISRKVYDEYGCLLQEEFPRDKS